MEYKYAVPIVRVMDLFPSIFQLATSALQLTVPMPTKRGAGKPQHIQPRPTSKGQKLTPVQEQKEDPLAQETSQDEQPSSTQPQPPPPIPPKDPMPPSPFPSFQRSPESVTTTIPDGASSFAHQFNYPPEVAEANNMMMQMKDSLGMLEVQFLLIWILAAYQFSTSRLTSTYWLREQSIRAKRRLSNTLQGTLVYVSAIGIN